MAGIVATLAAAAAEPSTYTVSAQAGGGSYAATGTVEAVRQGTLGAQVSGRVTAVLVRNGDAVKAGQALIRIDASDDDATATASAAAAGGAAARLASARADFERAQRLRSQEYISAAALQRAEAALKSAEAEARASGSQAAAAHTRAGWHTVVAPYSGRVTDLWVSAGDLATPGRSLLAIYDPTALRVIVQLPESLATRVDAGRPVQLVAATGAAVTVASWQMVPAVDAASHSVEVRAELSSAIGLQPGQFVSLLLPLRDAAAQLQIPARAVLRRSEVTAVYVIDAQGAARLRQVRLGPATGDSVVVLSGLRSGERVALDPLATGRQ
jgi:RND family efflux transporter MFP subunit